LRAADPLVFEDLKPYAERIEAYEAKGKTEAAVSGTGRLDGIEVALAVMDFSYIGGRWGRSSARRSPAPRARLSSAASR
jgi:acetyl-CoA carboxylase carboxyl transferase subunit beta